MQVIRSADWKPTPWKNGGGTTREIAVSPQGAALDDFAWRISAARVDQPGPFSIFPGIDRTLCILWGTGLNLTGPEIGAVHLDQTSPPFAFPADTPIDATLSGESILDLNVMTRRGIINHHVQRLPVAAETAIPIGATTIIVSLGEITATHQNATTKLHWGDTLILDSTHSAITISAQNPTEFIQITLTPN